jgi:hypothetical protein
LEPRNFIPQYETSLCSEKLYSHIVHFRPLLPGVPDGFVVMKTLTNDPLSLSSLPIQMRTGLEYFALKRPYPKRATVSLIRKKAMLFDFMLATY